ncbi:uncharacterized protein LOC124919481 isoform X2 [Impatiens glandulifera]|uniref:uncharacterized protein LOC124919481 isoform X2 n=1 Tax=Impatiens glandulifera TaxID=253017 RepID=UPI001FB06E50|nr:uncharacterized protein LOC124919481 isoform X2 [Impatiens glandulifera]
MSSFCGPIILLKHFSLSGSYHRGSSSSATFLKDYATWQFNAFLWISLISVTFLLLRKLYNLLRLLVKGSLIPGPSFYGHSKFMSGVNLTEVVSTLHDKYGSVVKLWLGPTQLLVSIIDTELIKEVLVKAEDTIPLTGRVYHLAFERSSLFVSAFGKVYSEIVNVWTNVREPMRKRISNVLFMLATLYESGRLLPAGPFLQRCALKHGAILMVPVQLLQTDSSSWGADACLFNPDHFFSKAGKPSHPINMTTTFPGLTLVHSS